MKFTCLWCVLMWKNGCQGHFFVAEWTKLCACVQAFWPPDKLSLPACQNLTICNPRNNWFFETPAPSKHPQMHKLD